MDETNGTSIDRRSALVNGQSWMGFEFWASIHGPKPRTVTWPTNRMSGCGSCLDEIFQDFLDRVAGGLPQDQQHGPWVTIWSVGGNSGSHLQLIKFFTFRGSTTRDVTYSMLPLIIVTGYISVNFSLYQDSFTRIKSFFTFCIWIDIFLW